MHNRESFSIRNIRCVSYESAKPECLLLQPVDMHSLDALNEQVRLIEKSVKKPFVLSAFAVEDWNKDLSPWKAPAVFGKEDFGDGAEKTLGFIESGLIPHLFRKYGSLPVVLGGYSLAGMFSLWAGFNSFTFRAVCAVSASMWFPGLLDYVRDNECKTSSVYLSLGDKEEKARNPVMATVGSCMRSMDGILSRKGIDHVLEWNEGNHFMDVDLRCAKGFAWAFNACRSLP